MFALPICRRRWRNRGNQTPDRAAVLSQAGAPLPWTSERADMLFVCEGVRKAANERQPQRAERAMYTEGADTFFVCE
jgi:hypothetical protein